MTNNKLIVLLIITFILSNLSSCNKLNIEQTAYVGGNSYYYNNKLYYIEHNHIKFISYDTYTSDYLCYDPLCKHDDNECLSYIDKGEYNHLVVDEQQSTDAPIIYVSYNYLYNDSEFINATGIMKIDIKNNRRIIVADNMECESINILTAYGDNLYFSATKGDNYYKLFMISKSGGKITQLTKTTDNNYYIHSVNNGLFYYYDDVGNLYETKDFNSISNVFTSKYPYGTYIHDGYLYYCDDEIYTANENKSLKAFDYQTGKFATYKWPTRSYTYYKISLKNTDSTPEVVIDNVIRSQKMLIQDDYFYIVSVSHKYLGSYTIYDNEYKLDIPIHVAVTTDGIYKINLDTLEKEFVKLNDDWQIYYILSVDKNKLIFYGENMAKVLENNGHLGMRYVIYDFNDQTYTIMEDSVNN